MKTLISNKELNERMCEALSSYRYTYYDKYSPTEYGVKKIIDAWRPAKNWIIEGFERSPWYNGNYQLRIPVDIKRSIDTDEVYNFINWVIICASLPFVSPMIGDTVTFRQEFERKIIRREDCRYYYSDSRYDYYYSSYDVHDNWLHETKDGRSTRQFFDWLCYEDNMMKFADEEFMKRINTAFPWIRCHKGQKVTRLIRRICEKLGLNTNPEFNVRYTRFADALSPMSNPKTIIISVNPIDYWMSSNGNSWTSCHWIDKPEALADGCNCGGTTSYMLDTCTVVMYALPADYSGDYPELEEKHLRQMYHIYPDGIIVQGRLYPQDNDCGAKEVYKNLREIAQRVLSGCFGWTNLWKVKKGTSECRKALIHEGLQYPDYFHFGNCNVSYNVADGNEEKYAGIKIRVGTPEIICPECGCYHSTENSILCPSCAGMEICEYCEDVVDVDGDDYIYTYDGRYFCCADCANEAGYVFVEDTCEYVSVDSTYTDSYDGEYHLLPVYIETEDGRMYSSEYNAKRDGYAMTDDGLWYPESEVYYCEHCYANVHESDWDDEHECCLNCLDEVIEETAELAVS